MKHIFNYPIKIWMHTVVLDWYHIFQVCILQDALNYLTPEGPISVTYPIPMEQIKFVSLSIFYKIN